jgi:hypothetical protein
MSSKQQEPRRLSSTKGRYAWKQSTGRAHWTDKDVWDLLNSLVQHKTEVRNGNFSEKAWEAAAAHLYPSDTRQQTLSDRRRFWGSLKQQGTRRIPPAKGRRDGWMESTSAVNVLGAFQSIEVWTADALSWRVSRVGTYDIFLPFPNSIQLSIASSSLYRNLLCVVSFVWTSSFVDFLVVSCTISTATTNITTTGTTTTDTTTTVTTTTVTTTTTTTTTTTAMSTSRQNTRNDCETQFNKIWDNRGSGSVIINYSDNTYKLYLIDLEALERIVRSLFRISYSFFEIVGWSLRRTKQGCKFLYFW